ncbi:MAG: amidohydrolase family protein [Myxococcales bacterium]|nr:amidohydrolase family protein [Myxococcales bacterium]
MGAIDYWCNAFTPDRRALWDASIAGQGVPLKIHREGDGFAEPAELVARMDELGFDTLVLPTCDLADHAGELDFESMATRPEEFAKWADTAPGRFVAAWSFDPASGMAGVRRAAEVTGDERYVGLHTHTHSFDRRFDHRDYYPFYALASDLGLPVVMQAGSSGGLMASECGRPIGIDRPAMYFPDVKFVLSHTGWPWVDEALAMAIKHANVFLGTATYPPRHWSAELLRFAAGPGRGKTLLGTGFPVVGHRHLLRQLDEVELSSEAREQLQGGAARSVFARIAGPR